MKLSSQRTMLAGAKADAHATKRAKIVERIMVFVDTARKNY
jgi:hypothetical protein